jgi:uncharacterized membrane protein YgdD (TMEM256/DUF423 family)
MHRWILFASGLLGALGVSAGALGAHGLSKLSPNALATFGTAAEYLLIHAVALASIAMWVRVRPESRSLRASALMMLGGTGLFSGGLIGWAVWQMAALRAVAPFGGTLLILSWGTLAIAGWRDIKR